MTIQEQFDRFWNEPVEGGSSYEEVYGSTGRDVALAAAQFFRQQALEESAAEAESWKGQKLRLMAGEMSGPELRAARTVTTTIARVLRNRAEVTGETS